MQTKEDIMILGFNESEATGLCELIECEYISIESYSKNELIADLSYNSSYNLNLILKNSEFDCKDCLCDYLIFENGIITKEGNLYLLTGTTYCYNSMSDKSNEVKLTITFESLEIKCKLLKAHLYMNEYHTAWFSLIQYAAGIYEKINQPYCKANEKEYAIAPLLEDMNTLYSLSDTNDNIHLDTLRCYLPKNQKVDLLFNKLQNKPDEKTLNNLFLTMSCEEFEPSWRRLVKLLDESQADYDKNENPEMNSKIVDMHNKIDLTMQNNNYDGTYPSYKKICKINGIYLNKASNNLNFVFNKEATILVECMDNLYDSYGEISFQISAVVGKPSDNIDKYSCFFKDKSKGYFIQDGIEYDIDENNEIHFLDNNVEQLLEIICKKAELKKMTLKEKQRANRHKLTRKEIDGILTLSFSIGLLAGTLLTLGFILIEFLTTLFLGRISSFSQLFLETPWWKIFLTAFLGFGGVMSLICIIKE